MTPLASLAASRRSAIDICLSGRRRRPRTPRRSRRTGPGRSSRCVDLGEQGRCVGDLDRHEPLPFGLEGGDVDDDPATRARGFADAKRQNVPGNPEIFHRPGHLRDSRGRNSHRMRSFPQDVDISWIREHKMLWHVERKTSKRPQEAGFPSAIRSDKVLTPLSGTEIGPKRVAVAPLVPHQR